MERGSLESQTDLPECDPWFLADYVDGTLDLESARSLEEHLRACGACMTYLLRA